MSFRQRQTICLVFALWLAMCSPASSQAFLTELVVGGSLAVELGGTLLAALPQIAVFTSSVLTLAQTSESIANTVGGILDVFTGSDGEEPPPEPSNGSNQAANPKPELAPEPKPEPKSEPSSGDEKAQDGQGLDSLIDSLVISFTRQISLLRQIQELPEGDPAREALGVGYGDLVSDSSEKIETIVTRILDGLKDHDEELVNGFIEKVEGMKENSRVALVPVLAQLVDRGKNFDALHAHSGSKELFQRLESLYEELT